MSQLLSDAHKAYDEGLRFISQGRRSDALERFAQSRQKTEEVRLVFPVNQEASILQLRIDQVIDPPAFQAMFTQRFNNDMAALRSKSPQSREAYADLLDLNTINPRYPGMQAALTEAEIILELRPPPPDPAAIARSNEYTRNAQAIVDAGVQSQMEVALTYINRALEENPNNQEAMRLKDIIVPLAGGTKTAVLDSETKREYEAAVRELLAGNRINALAIVERLLQEPKNKGVSLLLDLQQRIRSSL
jgi:tetratricopeptide (TPR) repeat protein